MAVPDAFELQMVRIYSQAASSVFASFTWHSLASVVLAFLAIAIGRRRYFSPISDVPGPFFASITRIWHVFHILHGKQSEVLTHLHKTHGPFVRIAHDEVSVSHAEAPKKLLLAALEKVSASLPPRRDNRSSLPDSVVLLQRRSHSRLSLPKWLLDS